MKSYFPSPLLLSSSCSFTNTSERSLMNLSLAAWRHLRNTRYSQFPPSTRFSGWPQFWPWRRVGERKGRERRGGGGNGEKRRGDGSRGRRGAVITDTRSHTLVAKRKILQISHGPTRIPEKYLELILHENFSFIPRPKPPLMEWIWQQLGMRLNQHL